jgi:hypothetical protein
MTLQAVTDSRSSIIVESHPVDQRLIVWQAE